MPIAKISGDYIFSVLEKYGFQRIRKTTKGYTACCKFHDDKAPSFSISNDGLWCCFACGVKGNINTLHEKLGGKLTWREELKIVGTQLNTNRFEAKKECRPPALPSDFKCYKDTTTPKYILDRLSPETIKHFKLGHSMEGQNKNRCVIPVVFKNKIVGFHSRALDNTTLPKYYNSPGFEIKDYVFNYDGCTKGKEVIVCEGAFNAMSMWEKGFKNTVATFGTKFTSNQIHKLFTLSPESIVVCFDRDSKVSRPGQKAAMHLASLTYQFVPTYIMPLPMDKDPNDLPADILLSCYQKKVPYEKVK
jgi:DNA primase